MNQDNQTQDSEREISLVDVVSFLSVSWKRLASAAFIGALLGLGGWFLVGQYSAEYILLNNTSGNSNSNNSNSTYALDIVSWKTIQKSLPNLASQVLGEGSVSPGQRDLYKDLADEKWWQKNIIPSYAISKADTKDLAGISRDLDAASTTILSLTVNATGGSMQSSVENVRAAAQFLRAGGAYLQLRNILNAYEGETISTVADIQKKITITEIEMDYQIQRLRALEDLHKRFPGNGAAAGQVVDPKDSGAKYLPISTQIIALNNDINYCKESLRRLSDRLLQLALIRTFLDEANPLAEKTFDGLVLGEQLLAIEMKLRSSLTKGDLKTQEVLDQLHAQLLQVHARFTKGLEANIAPSAKKTGVIKVTIGGFVAGFFLMLMMLLGKHVLVDVKSRLVK